MSVAVAPAMGQEDFQSVVLACNKDGMDSLRKGQSTAAFDQFKYAESLLIANQPQGETTSLLAMTCNNLGCYYKKVGKMHGALSYLRRALKMEIELDTDEVTVAGTHLNICAILSKLEKHDKAVQHALCALDLINKRVEAQQPDKASPDDYSVLAIAYHNVGVERDFLQEHEKAVQAFQKGHDVAKQFLGSDHPLALTLGSNCDAMLVKSQKAAKARSVRAAPLSARAGGGGGGGGTALPSLPGLPGAQAAAAAAAENGSSMPAGAMSVRKNAAEWVAGEEKNWSNFAHATLNGRTAPIVDAEQRSARVKDLSMPALPSGFQDIPFNTTRQLQVAPPVPYDAVELDREDNHNEPGRSNKAVKDYRPNRLVHGSTRTAKVTRRTGGGVVHDSVNRDAVVTNTVVRASGHHKQEYIRKMAAERIQRCWRAYYRYCQENADWMATTWVCATQIQAAWRSYRVRKARKDAAATQIQRVVRGYFVRKVLRQHASATPIQKMIRGYLTRKRLMEKKRAAIKIEALARGAAGRRRARSKLAHLTATAITIQCFVRQCIAKRRVRELRYQEAMRRRVIGAATDIQRCYRGMKGRQQAKIHKQEHEMDVVRYEAATKIQSMVRRYLASKRVSAIRAQRLDRMDLAATFIQKCWRGARDRRRYRELLAAFARQEPQVITIQRYARGFLVRLRMWREAIRAEEELWAALEIQRIWRGYCGRVRWEEKYEEVWRREMAAAKLQRAIRGYMARQRVSRKRRQIARAEFERARLRFRSAQRIQACARGMVVRKTFQVRYTREVKAAIAIQRRWRGHALRAHLWDQVLELRVTMLQANVRGWLVRKRRWALAANCICIQRTWRRWQRKPPHVKAAAREERRRRMESAKLIQQHYRGYAERREIGIIQDAKEG